MRLSTLAADEQCKVFRGYRRRKVFENAAGYITINESETRFSDNSWRLTIAIREC